MAVSNEEYGVLLEQARLGDRAALERLSQLYAAELRVVARAQLGPALRPYLDSLDLVQSVHRSLLLALRQDKIRIGTPQELLALAVMMVRRKVARHWRRLRRQERPSAGPGGGEREDAPNVLAELSCPDPDPGRAAQLRDAIDQLWGHLDETERRVIELRMQSCTTAEVGRRLGLDADSLRVRLSRLRVRLRASGVLHEFL
jgi:RNA polymerase sigma factor (sigma-70 family)